MRTRVYGDASGKVRLDGNFVLSGDFHHFKFRDKTEATITKGADGFWKIEVINRGNSFIRVVPATTEEKHDDKWGFMVNPKSDILLMDNNATRVFIDGVFHESHFIIKRDPKWKKTGPKPKKKKPKKKVKRKPRIRKAPIGPKEKSLREQKRIEREKQRKAKEAAHKAAYFFRCLKNITKDQFRMAIAMQRMNIKNGLSPSSLTVLLFVATNKYGHTTEEIREMCLVTVGSIHQMKLQGYLNYDNPLFTVSEKGIDVLRRYVSQLTYELQLAKRLVTYERAHIWNRLRDTGLFRSEKGRWIWGEQKIPEVPKD